MVDRLVEHGGVSVQNTGPGKKVLDVGCGVGGSSRHLARNFGCSVSGITLSPVQAQHATERSEKAGLAELTDFQVADALDLPFPDSSFDLVWSLEVSLLKTFQRREERVYTRSRHFVSRACSTLIQCCERICKRLHTLPRTGDIEQKGQRLCM